MMAALGHSTQRWLHCCLLSLTNEDCTAQEAGEAGCSSRSLCIRNGGIKQKALLSAQEVNTHPGSVGLAGPEMAAGWGRWAGKKADQRWAEPPPTPWLRLLVLGQAWV